MGKIFRGAEVTRIYVGSFNDEPVKHEEQFGSLFKKDHALLLEQLNELPSLCCMRKVNDMVKRIRLNVVHACVLGSLRAKMPVFYGGESARINLIKNLGIVFEEVKNTYHLSDGDFPNIDEFRAVLQRMDFYTFPTIDRKNLNSLQDMLSIDIPHILEHAPTASSGALGGISDKDKTEISGSLSMFSLAEEDEKKMQNHQNIKSHEILVAIIAVLIVIIGLIIASVLENHSTAFFIIEYIKNLIQNNNLNQN